MPMTFYVYTATDGLNYRHEDDPKSVTVFDPAMQPISPTFEVVDDCDCATSISANRFAIGYWKGVDLSLFDLDTGDLRTTFPFRKIGPLATFDSSGERLLFKSGSKTVLLNTVSGVSVDVKGVRAIDRLIVNLLENEAIIPSQKKSELLRISLETGEVTVTSIPFNATLFDLKLSPGGSRIIAIDRRKGVHCVDTSDWSVVWSICLRKSLGSDHVGVGQFSGDASLFGLVAVARDHKYTVVIDTQTGRPVNQFKPICYGLPHVGTTVRNRETQDGTYAVKTLDLSNGTVGTMLLNS